MDFARGVWLRLNTQTLSKCLHGLHVTIITLQGVGVGDGRPSHLHFPDGTTMAWTEEENDPVTVLSWTK